VVVSNDKSDATNSTQLVPSKIRTSMGMFFSRGENDLIRGRRLLVHVGSFRVENKGTCCVTSGNRWQMRTSSPR
jgi:hypothetical protein